MLLDEVEKEYNIKIELHTIDTISEFTGKLPAKNLDIPLRIISATYDLEAKKVLGNKIIFDEK